jgi:hypothetical protein
MGCRVVEMGGDRRNPTIRRSCHGRAGSSAGAGDGRCPAEACDGVRLLLAPEARQDPTWPADFGPARVTPLIYG